MATKQKVTPKPSTTHYVRARYNSMYRRYDYTVVSRNDMCCDPYRDTKRPTKYYAIGGELTVEVTVKEKK